MSSSSNYRFQVVSGSFRNDLFSTSNDVGGVGKVRPKWEAVDFAPQVFVRSIKKS